MEKITSDLFFFLLAGEIKKFLATKPKFPVTMNIKEFENKFFDIDIATHAMQRRGLTVTEKNGMVTIAA